MKKLKSVLLIVLVLFAAPALATSVGSIKNVAGEAWVIRADKQLPAVPGMRLTALDRLQTGSDGAIGSILQDDTIISIGPESELSLAEYVFHPEVSRFGMSLKIIKGTFSYLSGVMGKLSPESVKIETPVGMVAVRGTHFLVKVEK